MDSSDIDRSLIDGAIIPQASVAGITLVVSPWLAQALFLLPKQGDRLHGRRKVGELTPCSVLRSLRFLLTERAQEYAGEVSGERMGGIGRGLEFHDGVSSQSETLLVKKRRSFGIPFHSKNFLQQSRQHYGFTELTHPLRVDLLAFARGMAVASSKDRHVVAALADEMRRRRIVIPGMTVLERLAGQACTEAEEALFDNVAVCFGVQFWV